MADQNLFYYRVSCDSIDDVKIQNISDGAFRLWHTLLSLAQRSSERGRVFITPEIPFSNDDLKRKSNTREDVADCLNQLERFELIERDKNGIIEVINFWKYQHKYPSDSPDATRERKRKQREGECHEDVTSACHEDVTRHSILKYSILNNSILDKSIDTEPPTDKDLITNLVEKGLWQIPHWPKNHKEDTRLIFGWKENYPHLPLKQIIFELETWVRNTKPPFRFQDRSHAATIMNNKLARKEKERLKENPPPPEPVKSAEVARKRKGRKVVAGDSENAKTVNALAKNMFEEGK